MPTLLHFQAIVLSAGFGTRLAPLTEEVPKPLLPIGDTPLVGIHLTALATAGAERLFVNVHHHGLKISNYINSLRFKVHVSHEESILGTAGGIARIRSKLRSAPLLVVNGDIWGEIPVKALLATPPLGLRLALVPCALGEGTVGVGRDGNVVRLRGESFGDEVRTGNYMGACCLGEACLDTLPREGCLIGDWALPELRRGETIETVFVDADFVDIGTPKTYWDANLKWLADKNGSTSPQLSYRGEGVELQAAVLLDRCLLGSGSRIRGEGGLSRCILLPGASARAPLSNSIVTPAGVVVPVVSE